MTLKLTSPQAKHLQRNLDKAPRDEATTMAEFMREYITRVERIKGRHLRADEKDRARTEAIDYARNLRGWISDKKGSKNGN